MIHHIHKRIQSHTISLGHALRGVWWALSTQKNYQIHVLLSLCSILGGVWFQITSMEWIVVITLISVGLAIETINTAVESLSDAVTKEYNEHIRAAKDAGAGAMLFFSIGACIVAAILFVPRIFPGVM